MAAYKRKYTTGRELGVAQQQIDPQWRYRREFTLPNGKTVVVSGRPGAVNTKAAAEEAEREAIDRLLHPERYPDAEREPDPKERPTFALWWREQYVPTFASDTPGTVTAKISHFHHHLRPALGALRLDAIDSRALDVLRATLAAPTKDRKELSTKTVKDVLGTLHHALSKAVEWGELESLPKFPKIKAPDPEWDHLTITESNALLGAARDDRDRLLLWFALATGARAGEQLALKWSDIAWTEPAASVRFRRSCRKGVTGPTKSKHHRSVPLPPELADALLEARNDAGARELVFVDRQNRQLRLGQLHSALERTLKRAQLRKVRWHDLRHSFASHLVMAGVALMVVQQRLGHTTIAMTMRYSHLDPDHMRHFVSLEPAVREPQRSRKTAPVETVAPTKSARLN
jgi:integrase